MKSTAPSPLSTAECWPCEHHHCGQSGATWKIHKYLSTATPIVCMIPPHHSVNIHWISALHTCLDSLLNNTVLDFKKRLAFLFPSREEEINRRNCQTRATLKVSLPYLLLNLYYKGLMGFMEQLCTVKKVSKHN